MHFIYLLLVTNEWFSLSLSAEEPLYVSKVLQRVKVEVTEDGTKGSSAGGKDNFYLKIIVLLLSVWELVKKVTLLLLSIALGVIIYSRMAIPEHILNRPFLFLIQHKPTGQICCWVFVKGIFNTFLLCILTFLVNSTGAVLFMGQVNQPQNH